MRSCGWLGSGENNNDPEKCAHWNIVQQWETGRQNIFTLWGIRDAVMGALWDD